MKTSESIKNAPPSSMLYPELFMSFERVRWSMEKDIPWDLFDGNKLSEDQAITIKIFTYAMEKIYFHGIE